MRISKAVAPRLSLALVIAGSTLAITCASRTSIQNEPVQLASIRRVEAKLDRLVDTGIRNGLLGGRTAFVADEFATNNVNGELDESGRQRIFSKRLRYWRVTGQELTVPELQRIRTALHLRVDQAYASRGDLANFADLQSLKIDANGIAGSLNNAAIGQ